MFRIEPTTANAYYTYTPLANPGGAYMATNDQLYGSNSGPTSAGQPAPGPGFVTNYAYTLRPSCREETPLRRP